MDNVFRMRGQSALYAVTALFMAFAGLCDETVATQNGMAGRTGSPQAATEGRRISVSQAVGGFVIRPPAPGSVWITVEDIRARKDDAPEKFVARVASMMHLATRVGKAGDGDLVLRLTDEGRMAIYPEELVADVPAGTNADETQHRLMSALIRIIGISGDKFGPHVMDTAVSQARELGIGQVIRATYRSAVRDGWAPPPTNDAQRAIWDKFHSSTNIADKAGNEDVAPPTNAPIR